MSETQVALRKKKRKEAKDRARNRINLIKESVRQSRTTRDINDVRSDKVGAWNYELSADSDIYKRCCPLCFQAYSDFELTAVVPCWHCRDKMPLAQAIAIAASVSVPEDNNPSEEVTSNDAAMIASLHARINHITRTEKHLHEQAKATVDTNLKKQLLARARRYKQDNKDDVKDMTRRIRLIQEGREEEYFQGITLKSRKKQQHLSGAKATQRQSHAQSRLEHLQRKLSGGGAYELKVHSYPPHIYCTKCGVSRALSAPPAISASKPIGSIVSSQDSITQIHVFAEEHSEHTMVRLSVDYLRHSHHVKYPAEIREEMRHEEMRREERKADAQRRYDANVRLFCLLCQAETMAQQYITQGFEPPVARHWGLVYMLLFYPPIYREHSWIWTWELESSRVWALNNRKIEPVQP